MSHLWPNLAQIPLYYNFKDILVEFAIMVWYYLYHKGLKCLPYHTKPPSFAQYIRLKRSKLGIKNGKLSKMSMYSMTLDVCIMH